MLLQRWENSHQNKCMGPGRSLKTAWHLVLLLPGLAMSAPTQAQHNVPLTLAEAEDSALNQEPGQAAYLAQAEAYEEQSVAAGQLPDPELRMGLANYPIQSGGFTTEGMTQAQLGLRISFPPGDTRAHSTHQFESMAVEMDQNAVARGRDVLTSVRSAWLDVYYWELAHEIVSESRPYFEDLVTVTRSLYAVGRKDQQDVLRADLELSRLEDRLIDIERQQASARAALSEWVGSDSKRPMAKRLPSWNSVPAMELLQEELAHHPALQAADARIDARVAGSNLAEENYKSGWDLDVGYGYRDGFQSNGDPRSDFISVSVTIDLPFFRKNRQDRSLAAALGEQRAATESKNELLRRLNSQLEAEYARWQSLSRRIDLYEKSILTQAKEQSNAALVAYQSESSDFSDVMRSSIDEIDIRLDYMRLQTERAQSYAVLANLGGLPR